MNPHLASCFKLILLTFILLLFYNCNSPTEISQEHEPWSSADPLSVNYRIRQQKYTQGNLVHNPSFELGKVKQVDSLTQSIVIEGWDFVGQNIRWLKILTDSVSEGNPYIHSGNRSIKIIRKNANETDEIGAGVISDYIRVVPGNYNLSMYLNLINIENPKSRLGTRIYDAVDIRIIYYDKNKITISGKQFSPYHNVYFNNSFKGESLSKFTNIDSTGWIHVQGRSHLFPVPDGDIQDNAKFIRIFIGLKGNGIMNIDDISYKYTRWNFTQLERLEPYFDTTFSMSQLIIPQPRSVKVMESIIYYRPYYKDIFPVILIPENADHVTIQAAERLEDHIQRTISELTNTEIDIIPGLITNSISDQVRQSTVTFSIGETDLFRNVASAIPLEEIENKEQGFLVHTTNDDPSVIYLVGNSNISNYYAVQAVLQLFDNRRLLFHNANIIDYPESTMRPLLLSNISDYSMEFLRMTKAARYNQVYIPTSTDALEQKVDQFNQMGIYSIRLYTNLEKGIGMLPDKVFNKLLTENNSTISGYTLINEPFNGENLTDVDPIPTTNIIKELGKLADAGFSWEIQLDNSKPGISASEFNEAIYGNENANKNVSFIWTGNGSSTWKLDEADYLYNMIKFPGKKVFMDLTLYPRDRVLNYFMYDSLWPGKLAKASLFESYDNEVVPEVYSKADKTILAFKVVNIFDVIRLQTASDFFWNPDNYDPDLSLYRALITTFGVRLSKDLLYFNDYYFKARSELILANSLKNNQKHIRRADAYIKEMNRLQSTFLAQDQIKQNTELINLLSSLIEEVKIIREKQNRSSLDAD